MNRIVSLACIGVLAALSACMNMEDGNSAESTAKRSDGQSTTNSVNESISVGADESVDDVSTVNGSIRIDSGATAKSASTVNGSINVGSRASADSLTTVNGAIRLDEGARVSGNVSAVNGSITLQEGADVGGKLANVNGRIVLEAAHVGSGIKTVNGGIRIGRDSRVEGGILVQKSSSPFLIHFGKGSIPKVVIGPNATVEGTLRFEQKVNLYVSDSARIGPVEGATPIKFSGDRPPG